MLNRLVEWADKGVQVEADQRHAELIVKMMDLGKANTVVTPGLKDEDLKMDISDEKICQK